MDNRPIGMFDSGVGGLTVYKEVKKMIPNEKIIYLGDTKRFPYGSKTKETIIEFSKECIEFLISKNVKMIIIACGTATSYALEQVKNIYNIPIIGIIDPTVDYIQHKRYKKIGVIATRGTILSGSWEAKLKNERHNIQVVSKECPLLAPMAEEGWTENEIAKLTLIEYLKGMQQIDALILGCTHYPLFEKTIRQIMPDTEIINPGKEVAKLIGSTNNITTENKYNENLEGDEFYLTFEECNFIHVVEKILGKNIKINLQIINIEEN